LQRGVPHLKTARYGLHFVRDAAGFSSFLCLFAALKSIPLINAMLLSYTEPLWIPLIAWIWPGVRMRGHIWWGIVVGFFGMVLILQPSAGGHNLGTFLAILSGILAGLTFILIHRLASTEPTYRILFYNSLFGMLITAPLASFYLSRLSMVDLFCLIGVGGFTFISQYLVTYAFKHGNATMLGSLAYTVVLFSGVLGWALWGEIPNSISLFGMILVIIGGICAVYFEKKYQKSIL
jgi:drug/metabolite transporter (DMT)-like permease